MILSENIFYKPARAIVLLTLLQTLSATWLLRVEWLGAINSIIFLFSGCGISYLVLKIPSFPVKRKAVLNRQQGGRLIVLILLLPAGYMLARKIIDGTPLQKEYADMLPVIKTMCTRFIQGHWRSVYDPIPEIWNGIQPVYLPAMWLPFSFAISFHFDLRWITVCGIWLSILLCILPGRWKRNGWYALYILALLILLAWLHFDKVNNVIRLTEEGVVYFFYSLMAVAIISGNPWWTGFSAMLCLLSRYSLAGWIPFAVIYLLIKGEYRFLWKAFVAGVALLLVLTLPFGWHFLALHLHLPAAYISHAERVWNENPEFFYHSPGMAKFFGAAHTGLQHYILLLGTFSIPLLFLPVLKKKKLSTPVVLLSGFQFSISFFYSFLDVSYLYLYYTPVLVSLVIAGWAMAADEV